MTRQTVALFGEAEKGELASPQIMQSLVHLSATLGNPPEESKGIYLGVQFLLHQHDVIFIRVKEEGFSTKEYLRGMKTLLQKKDLPPVTAICMPGVGDRKIIDSTGPIVDTYGALLITTERDLYDYLTALHIPIV